jgi:hypothetical protein
MIDGFGHWAQHGCVRLPMKNLRRWIAAGLLSVSTGVFASATFDGGSGLLTLSAVQVGSATFTNVVLVLINPANYSFRLQAATLQTPAGSADITFDGSTGILTIPSVMVGNASYSVTFQITDPITYTFVLASATLLAPSAEAAGVRHRTIAAWGWGGGGICVLLRDGTARCLGNNAYGTLGVPTGTETPGVPTQVSTLSGATQLIAGYQHLCALIADGTVRCWGNNQSGQLGNGTVVASSTPVTVSGIAGAVAIAAGAFHSCALLGDGTVHCWGSDGYGELGNGKAVATVSTPVVMVGATNVVSISAGGRNTCIVKADGTVQCLGNGTYGELGNNSTADQFTFVTALNVAGAVGVYITGFNTCALVGAGNAACWGTNYFGVLGNGTTLVSSNLATAVMNLTNAISLINGWGASDHKCAVLSDGTMRCWGRNGSGQLGDGTVTDSSVPVKVVGIDDAVAAAAGVYDACAVRSDGTVWCWGLRPWDGATSNVPQPVAGIVNAQ